ncbi:MAG TPA: RNA polymerase sigma factor [Gaiellaceae bacterium]
MRNAPAAECDEQVMAARHDSRTDAELLRRARRDPDAFIAVCARHGEALQAWLRRELGDDRLAQELLAETFATAWLASARFREQGDGAGPWLYGIAHNLVRRLRRQGAIERRARQRIGLPVTEEDSFEPVIERLGAAQQLGELDGEIDRLPVEQREALELRVIEALDYAEVGRRLRISPGAARARVFRALSTLRAQIGEQP